MTPTGVLLVTPIFLWGVGFASLLAGHPRVALALHNARCGTPFWVTISSWRLQGAPVMTLPARTRKRSHRHSLSTVLAQDHFYSDFLSLHVTLLTPKSARMMRQSCSSSKEGPLGLLARRIDDSKEEQHSDWSARATRERPISQPDGFASMGQICGSCLCLT